MAFVHRQSCEGVKSELDLFTVPPTQNCIIASHVVEHQPTASLDSGGPIEFFIPGSGDDYIDLANTKIHVQVKVTQPNGANLDAAAPVGPVNNWLHSLFSQVDVFLNGTLVTQSTNTYAYRAFVETLLTYGVGAKSTQLTNQLWYKDKASRMSAVDLALEKSTVKYPLRPVSMKVYSIPAGARSHTHENLFLNTLPKRLVLCCIDNDAYNGAYDKNPFHAKNNAIGFHSVYVDGRQIPSKPFQPNFEDNLFVRCYTSLFTSTGKIWQDEGNGLTRDDYRDGYTFFCFDLTPDQCDGPCFNLVQKSNLRIEFHFRERRRLRRIRIRAGNRQESQRHLRLLRWTPCRSLVYWRWIRTPRPSLAALYPKTDCLKQ